MTRGRQPTDAQHKADMRGVWVRLKTGLYAMGVATALYLAVMFIEPGPLTYILSLPGAAIVLITAVARIDSLSVDMGGPAWNVRRMGLGMTAIFAMGVFAWPFLLGQWTPWLVVFGISGFAMTWLTTPHQPPWLNFVFGDYKGPKEDCPHRRKEDDFDANP